MDMVLRFFFVVVLFIVVQFENCIDATCILFMNKNLTNHKRILLDAVFHYHPPICLVRLGYVAQNINSQSSIHFKIHYLSITYLHLQT